MTEYLAAAGTDTWVRDDHPRKRNAGGVRVRLQASHRLGLIHVPITGIRGRTVLSATLIGHVRDTFSDQTVTVKPITQGWAAGKVTWNSRPTVGAGVATALSGLTDGDAASLDVTTLVQAVANGTDWRGVQLSTSATTADRSNWYSFDSGKPAWSLVIELSDAPEQPSDLRPDGGAVGSAAPILAWSYTDLGGTQSEQGAYQVQVDPAADEVSPAYDSGTTTSTEPQHDLSAPPSGPAFTPLATHAATQWRVRTQDADGNWSDWSDWASFSYEPLPTLVMDSPTGGTIGDPTPDVIAHLTGETLEKWRVRVLGTDGSIRYDSGLSTGTIDLTIPERNRDRQRVIARDDADYDFEVTAYGDVERAVAVGQPGYVRQTTRVSFDADAGVTVPTDFTLAPASTALRDPRITFTWQRTEAADAWLILRDGAVHARLEADDVTVDAGTYTYTDQGQADPYVAASFTVRAIESGARSNPSNAVSYMPTPAFVWLLPDGIDPVALDSRDGNASLEEFATKDRRGTYQPLHPDGSIATDIDIVYGLEGISGTYTGGLPIETEQDVTDAAARLEALRLDVAQRPRLVYNTRSIPVIVRNLTVLPAADFTARQRVYLVSFDFIQAGD